MSVLVKRRSFTRRWIRFGEEFVDAANNVNDCFPNVQAQGPWPRAAKMAIRLMAKRCSGRFPPCTKRGDDGIFRPGGGGSRVVFLLVFPLWFFPGGVFCFG